jgi:hypothetical protein
MNPKALADLGFGLAKELEQDAYTFYIKDDGRYDRLQFADEIRVKAQDVLNLSSNTEILKLLESSTLLSHATQLPYPASLDERVKQFEQLYAALVDFAHAEVSWEAHFAAHHQRYVELWEEPKRWEQEYQEKQRIAAEEIRRLFAEDLAYAKEKSSKPTQPAPCFAETRKNGLNCNRSDLLEIKKLPTIVSTNKKIEITIKRCSQCWQIYKEYFEVNEVTKQFRSRVVNPKENDNEHALHF